MKQIERINVLAELGAFSREDLEKRLMIPPKTVDSLITSYLKQGLIKRVRQGLYAAISLESKGTILNRYQLACRLASDAAIINHSAFEFYGLANQVYHEVFVATKTRQRDFCFDGINYRFFLPKVSLKINVQDDVRVTTLEQTVIDSINDIDKLMGVEELLNCLETVPALKETELLAILEAYNSGYLYQKTGFILEHLKDDLKLSDEFFITCQKHLPKRKNYFTMDNSVNSKTWNIAGPNLHQYFNQGMRAYYG